MTESEFVIDTSAWIEYFLGTSLGLQVKEVLENPHNQCYYPNEVIMEMSSKSTREGRDARECCDTIRSMAHLISCQTDDYVNIGIKHAVLKKSDNRISYTDAVLWYLCESRRLKLLTKDAQLKAPFTRLLR